MNLEAVREYCLKKKGVTEDFPFDEETLVLKVMSRMFLLTNLNPPYTMNVKCDPRLAVELRERYEEVTPGYHMNKTHWNTVDLEGTIPTKEIFEMIDNSYDLVVNGLKKKEKDELAKL
ncbi:MAG: MmcQ/YjbR family DNA-binding protein [Ignavibacteriaceae bacterium]